MNLIEVTQPETVAGWMWIGWTVLRPSIGGEVSSDCTVPEGRLWWLQLAASRKETIPAVVALMAAPSHAVPVREGHGINNHLRLH